MLEGTILALALFGSPVSAEPDRIERTNSLGGHNARVALEIGRFDPKQHRMRLLQPQGHTGGSCIEVDGNPRPLGTDCDAPSTEIRRLSLTLDGAVIDVPSELYRDCFNPRTSNSLGVRLADGGRGAFVFFAGSDAAGSYQVVWVLRADGRHSRLTCGADECSDAGIINFDAAFLSTESKR